MRVLVVGLGSMGKRRIRNLQYLKAEQIVGFDPRADRRSEATERFGVQTYATIDDAIAADTDAVIISTPPDHHLEYARLAIVNGKHFFSEVGVGVKDIDDLIELTHDKDIVAALSCTLRFHPVVKIIKSIVERAEIGKVLSFLSHSGQYLPDWHPWEDYRTFWASHRETGACREQLVLEATWLTWVLGPVRFVSCFKDKLTSLDTDIDDVYQILVRLEQGTLGQIMLDAVSRVPYRTGKLFGEDGVVEWNLTEYRVAVFSGSEKKWREHTVSTGQVEKGYIHSEQMYIEEMRHFLEAISGTHQWPHPLTEARQIQELLEAADHSADTGQRIELSTNH